MPGITILGGAIYNQANYKNFARNFYFPLANMKISVAKLKASKEIDIETVQFGHYQPVLAPLNTWPDESGERWWREMGRVRVDLAEQPNDLPLSDDEPDVVPLTKCSLLDAAIRKCFNAEPDPIPMWIDVEDSRHANRHDIRVVWETASGAKVPSLLKLTMICPYRKPEDPAK